MTKILDGKKLATTILADLHSRVAKLSFQPGLAVIMVGDDPASTAYVNQKRMAASAVGVKFFEINFPTTVTTEDLILQIATLNQRDSVHGLIVQLPLPVGVATDSILNSIDPLKDVDGFHPVNHGRNVIGDTNLLPPATPAGIMRLLAEYDIPLEGREVVIVGHSNIVGKPLASMMLNANATVTVCHKFTQDLAKKTKQADVLISATGVPHLIKAAMVKKDAVVVDVGCAKVKDRLVGDVDFEKVQEKTSFITPVPGGVGPMTVAMLIANVVTAAERVSGRVVEDAPRLYRRASDVGPDTNDAMRK